MEQADQGSVDFELLQEENQAATNYLLKKG
jgi:hypothetical protein